MLERGEISSWLVSSIDEDRESGRRKEYHLLVSGGGRQVDSFTAMDLQVHLLAGARPTVVLRLA